MAAIVYTLGYAYFWPVMVGAVAQRVPLSSALGMSIIGAVGMFSTAIFKPIIGSWIDGSMAEYSRLGLTGNELQLAAGQETLEKMVSFPAFLIVLFIVLFFWQRNSKKTGEIPVEE